MSLTQDEPFMLQTAWFGKVLDAERSQLPALTQLANRVVNDDNAWWLLAHFSQIYVLIFEAASDAFSEVKWPHYKIDFGGAPCLVAGYMAIEWKSNTGQHYIYYIDTLVRGHGLADYMMRRYETQFGCDVFPREILITAAGFWKKWFAKRRNIKTKRDLCDLRSSLRVNEWLEWDALILDQ
jgi:hypothetical protein